MGAESEAVHVLLADRQVTLPAYSARGEQSLCISPSGAPLGDSLLKGSSPQDPRGMGTPGSTGRMAKRLATYTVQRCADAALGRQMRLEPTVYMGQFVM